MIFSSRRQEPIRVDSGMIELIVLMMNQAFTPRKPHFVDDVTRHSPSDINLV